MDISLLLLTFGCGKALSVSIPHLGKGLEMHRRTDRVFASKGSDQRGSKTGAVERDLERPQVVAAGQSHRIAKIHIADRLAIVEGNRYFPMNSTGRGSGLGGIAVRKISMTFSNVCFTSSWLETVQQLSSFGGNMWP